MGTDPSKTSKLTGEATTGPTSVARRQVALGRAPKVLTAGPVIGFGLAGAVVLLGIGYLAVRHIAPGDHDTWSSLIRSVAFGAAAIVAIPAAYVAYRKQRMSEYEYKLAEARRQDELDKQDHIEREARAATERLDGTEARRLTELREATVRANQQVLRERFVTLIELLGSDKAPVRIGAVHGIAQLADEWMPIESEQVQACVSVLCAYMRMPWPESAGHDEVRVREAIFSVIRKRMKRASVQPRDSFQRGCVLNPHVEVVENSWSDLDFDFSDAEFPSGIFSLDGVEISPTGRFSLTRAVVKDARLDFRGCNFFGEFDLEGMVIEGGVVNFSRCVFDGAQTNAKLRVEGGSVSFAGSEFRSSFAGNGTKVHGGELSFAHVVLVDDATIGLGGLEMKGGSLSFRYTCRIKSDPSLMVRDQSILMSPSDLLGGSLEMPPGQMVDLGMVNQGAQFNLHRHEGTFRRTPDGEDSGTHPER